MVEIFHNNSRVKGVLDIFLEIKMKICRSWDGHICREFKPADILKIQFFVSKSGALSPFYIPRHMDNIGFLFILQVDLKYIDYQMDN